MMSVIVEKNAVKVRGQQGLGRLFALLLIIFIDSLAYFIAIPVLVRLLVSNQAGLLAVSVAPATRNLLYSIAIMISPLALIIASPIVGNLSDRFGRKKILSTTLFAALLGFFLPIVGIYLRHISLVFIGRFITGAASASKPIAQAAITDFSRAKQKAFYLSMTGFAMTLAMVLGPIAGAFFSDHNLISWFDVTTPYWVGVLLALVNLLFLFSFFRETVGVKSKHNSIPLSINLKMLLAILLEKKTLRLFVAFFLLEIAWSQYYQMIFLYLPKLYHYTPNKTSLFAGYIGIWMCLGLSIIYKLMIRQYTIQRCAISSVLLVSFGLLGCTLIPGVVAQWIFVTPVAIFTGIAYASLLALISEHSSAQHQGWIIGCASTLLGLAWMITAFLSGWFINMYTQLPLIFATIIIIIAALIIMPISSKCVTHQP